MEAAAFKLTIHMVSSVDGYIAKKDNSISWFDTNDNYPAGIGEQDAATFLKTIDCYVMGARTYEHALELSALYGWPYGDTPVIVVTHRTLPVNRDNIKFYAGDLVQLLSDQLKPNYKNVWLIGGPTLVKEFMRLNLADEIRQSVLPVLLGDGIPFFGKLTKEQAVHLNNVTAYRNGVVELCYDIKK